jgi:hypothetical protein
LCRDRFRDRDKKFKDNIGPEFPLRPSANNLNALCGFFTVKVAERSLAACFLYAIFGWPVLSQFIFSGIVKHLSLTVSPIEMERAHYNEIQFLFFFVIPVPLGNAKKFQLSHKRPSKVDLQRLKLKGMNGQLKK